MFFHFGVDLNLIVHRHRHEYFLFGKLTHNIFALFFGLSPAKNNVSK